MTRVRRTMGQWVMVGREGSDKREGYGDEIFIGCRWIVLSGVYFVAKVPLFMPVSMLTIEGVDAFPAIKRFSF